MSKPTGPLLSFMRSTSRLTLLIVLCASVSLICGLIGWTILRGTPLNLNAGDILYRSIAALTLAVPYQSSEAWQQNVFIEVARWSGMIALIAGASKTVVYLFESHWAKRRAQRRRDHWIVIGDDAFAARLCDASVQQGNIVHWLTCDERQTQQQNDKQVFIDNRYWHLAHAVELGLHNAKGVVVSTYNDATSHAIAREIRTEVPDEHQLVVMASIQSPWLGMRIDEIEGTSRVNLFSEAQVAVRRLQRRHPPFLLAEKMQQDQLHIVIVGFSGYGEAVLIETLLSSLTTTLAKPIFTIVDPAATSIRNNLRLRYPELDESAEIHFVDGDLSSQDAIIDRSTLLDVAATAPITGTYCCNRNDGKALSSALAMQAVLSKQSENSGPVFTRQTRSNSLPRSQIGVDALKPGELVSFGALDELAKDTGIFSDHIDGLARTFHNAYQSIATKNKPSNIPWEDLSEDMRDASRRLVIHIPAKLHCLGLDLEHWLQETGDQLNVTELPKIDIPQDRSNLIEQLAELEHERWMVERRINGWTFSSERDNFRRLHPDLIPYNRLSDESKSYDRKMVASLIEMVSS